MTLFKWNFEQKTVSIKTRRSDVTFINLPNPLCSLPNPTDHLHNVCITYPPQDAMNDLRVNLCQCLVK